MLFDGLGLSELIILVAAFTVYFMPWYIAVLRAHDRHFRIGLLNLLLGWTLIGWLAAFLWATSKVKAGHDEKGAEQTYAMKGQVPTGTAAERKYSRAS